MLPELKKNCHRESQQIKSNYLTIFHRTVLSYAKSFFHFQNVEENFVFSDFTNQLFSNDHDDWTDVEAEKLSLPSFYETINDSILKEEEIVKAEECRFVTRTGFFTRIQQIQIQ